MTRAAISLALTLNAISVETAIRAWVEPLKRRIRKAVGKLVPWRPQPYGERVLAFDTETTTDHAQRLLFAFFRLYGRGRLVLEGIIAADVLDSAAMDAISAYAAKCRLPVYSRERFVEEIFYPEVYGLGTLCVGFNLGFDLARIALNAGCGRGKNRRSFRIVLSRRLRWPDLRIEQASGHAAFIAFAPKHTLARWERPFFKGRFLDLSTLSLAFTGKSLTLKRACMLFKTHTRKMGVEELGRVTRETLTYGRQDVRVTWALYRKLRDEYAKHPFATFAHERAKPKTGLYMGEVYSSASIAKGYLRLLRFRPALAARTLNPVHFGYGMASYVGGRAETRVRRRDVPVAVVDFSAMYPAIIVLQNLQALMRGGVRARRVPVARIERFLASLAPEGLCGPATWCKLNYVVLVEPNGAALPVRMRPLREERMHAGLPDSYGVALAALHASEPRWCTLADIAAALLSGGRAPKIRRAVRLSAQRCSGTRAVLFRGRVPLRANEPVLKTLVEERQRAKQGAKGDEELARLEAGLKVTANSMYGICAEVNVTPHKADEGLSGMVYSDIAYRCANVHDERSGAFSNPIVASLITGGARLMLALLEYEVAKRGGTFAFADTDALAIVCGKRCPKDVPCLSHRGVEEIVARFDRLSPYDPAFVPHFLKVEYEGVRCWSVSAKRYVLYRIRAGRRVEIVKTSESGLGAILGRTRGETTTKLARRIWLAILLKELKGMNPRQRRRAKPLVAFDAPLRRKFPVSQPSVLQRLAAYNRMRAYDYRVKPYGFVQSVTPAVVSSEHDVLPIAPFEGDLAKAKRLPWIDFHTGKPVQLDWNASHLAGTIPVMRMSEYVEQYRRHPEWKAADRDGEPAGPETRGVLGRLAVRSVRLARIGKEIDRLDQGEGASLEGDEPVEFEGAGLADDIALLAAFPQESTAREIGISVRRWRDILKGRAEPRGATAESIARAAAEQPLSSSGSATLQGPPQSRAKRRRQRQTAAPRRSRGACGG